MPLTLQRELRFAPPLPEHRLRALAEATYGSARKEAALFAEPPTLPAPTVMAEGVVYVSDEDPRMLVRFAGAGAASRRLDFAELAGAPARVTPPSREKGVFRRP